jgi:hypothetical protein
LPQNYSKILTYEAKPVGDAVGAFKEHRLLEDVFLWVYAIDTDPATATLDDYIEACKNGIEHLKKFIS